MTPCNIFYDYMEAYDQIQRNFQIIAVFMHARASKIPYHQMRVNNRHVITLVSIQGCHYFDKRSHAW